MLINTLIHWSLIIKEFKNVFRDIVLTQFYFILSKLMFTQWNLELRP